MLRFAITAFGLPLLASLFITETSKSWPDLQQKLGRVASTMTDARPATSSSALSVAPHEISQPAFLWVTAETGELCTDEEFNGETARTVTGAVMADAQSAPRLVFE